MVFNSSQNNFNSTSSQAESFEVLRNSYNVTNSGYDYQPALRPSDGKDFMFPTDVHSMVSHYDQNELKYLNHDTMRSKEPELSGNGTHRRAAKVAFRRQEQDSDSDSDDEMIGEGWFKKARKRVKKTANKASKTTKKTANKASKTTRKTAEKINRETKPLQKKIAKSVTDKDGLLHKAIGKTLDYALPAAGEALGAAAGAYTGNPALGAMVGKKVGSVGRNALKSKTGYGIPGVGQHNKGNIDLEKTLNKYAPQYKNDMIRLKKPDTTRRIQPVNGRCEVVKQIMKEKGMSLPEASKYVKQNNLW
jgi:histone H1/5